VAGDICARLAQRNPGYRVVYVRGGHLAGFGWCPARIVIARLGL